MDNRDGEFVLVIDTGNEMNLVDPRALTVLISSLEQVYRAAGLAYGDETAFFCRVYFSASPEYGSVRFGMVAAGVAAGLAVTADVSGLVGVNLRDVVEATATVLAPQHSPTPSLSPNAAKCIVDASYIQHLSELVQAANKSPFSSVRLEVPGCVTLELTTDLGRDQTVSGLKASEQSLLRHQRDLELDLDEAKARNDIEAISKLSERLAISSQSLARVRVALPAAQTAAAERLAKR